MSLQKSDVGTILTITVTENGVAKDISGATTKDFIFRRPTGSIVTKAASYVTTGVDGKLKYAFIAGDLNEAGTWKVQAHLVIGTNDWRTSIGSFEVNENLS